MVSLDKLSCNAFRIAGPQAAFNFSLFWKIVVKRDVSLNVPSNYLAVFHSSSDRKGSTLNFQQHYVTPILTLNSDRTSLHAAEILVTL